MTTCAHAFNVSKPWELEMAATLSQIGWVTLPAAILEKIRCHQDLSGQENDLLGRVPEIGYNLLSHIPRLETVAEIIRYQAKNFDGSGFPLGDLAGENIPIGARILRVLSDLLLIESHGLPKFKALAKMRACAGRYDPTVLEFVGSAFDVFVPNAAKGNDAGRPVTFKELRVGQVLMSDVLTQDDTKIVMAGTEITPVLLVKLRNFASLSGIKEPILAAG